MKALVLSLACLASSAFAEDVSIGSFEKGSADGWTFYNGKEFPGAQGSFAIIEDSGSSSGFAASLDGAFAGGGAYVSISRSLPRPLPFKALKFKVKSSDYDAILIRLVDGTGQVHQHCVDLKDASVWRTLVVKDFKGKKYCKWGGANDAQWHDPLKGVSILIEKSAIKDDLKSGTVFVSDIVLEE